MNSNDNKSSRELKREVIQELNQVSSDIDRIQRRLTPGQLIDDAIFLPVGRNPRAVFDRLKANPIGTAFLSIGTLLLMEDEGHVTYEAQMRSRSSSVLENSRYQATLLKGQISDLKGDVAGRVSGVSDQIHGVIDHAKEKVSSLGGKANPDAQEATTGATGFDQLKETAFKEVETVRNLDPMTYLAIGVGLGALTGISLPVSEKEQSFIDQKASGKLNEFSSEFQDAINESVRVLKDEFLERFTDFDLGLFGKKSAKNDSSQGPI